MFYGSPAVITFRIPTKAALQVLQANSPLYLLLFLNPFPFWVTLLFSHFYLIIGGIFNSYSTSRCPGRKTSWEDVWVGKFLVGISNAYIYQSFVHLSSPLTEAFLFCFLVLWWFGPNFCRLRYASSSLCFSFQFMKVVKGCILEIGMQTDQNWHIKKAKNNPCILFYSFFTCSDSLILFQEDNFLLKRKKKIAITYVDDIYLLGLIPWAHLNATSVISFPMFMWSS